MFAPISLLKSPTANSWLTTGIILALVVVVNEAHYIFLSSVTPELVSTMLAIGLLFTVAVAGYLLGRRGGVLASIVATIYLGYSYIRLSMAMTGNHVRTSLMMAVLVGIAYLCTGWLVGWLQDQNRHLFDQQSAARKDAETERRLLEAIIQQLPVGIVVASAPDGKIVYTNQELSRLSGRPGPVDLAQAFADYPGGRLFTLDKKPLSPKQWPVIRALQKQHIHGEEILYKHNNGSYRTVRVNGAPVIDRHGQVLAAVVTIMDVNKEKDLEKRKDEFLSMASHELKNPLASLKVYTQILARQLNLNEQSAQRDIITKMDSQLAKLVNLTNDLLDLSRIAAGKLTYRPEQFSLPELLDDIVTTLRPTTHHHILVEGSINQAITGDRDRLGQVFINLITNAIKYSPDGDKIIISLHQEGGNAIISIQDFGIGISAEDKTKIFTRYFQVRQHANIPPGLGLGLYITAKIVRHHHGKLWVNSQPGQGSIFYCRLPLMASKFKPEANPSAPGASVSADSTTPAT